MSGFDLNKVEGNIVGDFPYKWLDVTEMALKLTLLIFKGQISNTMGFDFFLNSFPCVWKA